MIKQVIAAKLGEPDNGDEIQFTVDERRLILRELNWENNADGEFLYTIFETASQPISIQRCFVIHLDELLKE